MTKQIKLDEGIVDYKPTSVERAAPVCPGCRKTVTDVNIVSKPTKLDNGGGMLNMVSLCCGGCKTILKFDLIPFEEESELLVPDKPKVKVVH